jgi:hypothetical protein
MSYAYLAFPRKVKVPYDFLRFLARNIHFLMRKNINAIVRCKSS